MELMFSCINGKEYLWSYELSYPVNSKFVPKIFKDNEFSLSLITPYPSFLLRFCMIEMPYNYFSQVFIG